MFVCLYHSENLVFCFITLEIFARCSTLSPVGTRLFIWLSTVNSQICVWTLGLNSYPAVLRISLDI